MNTAINHAYLFFVKNHRNCAGLFGVLFFQSATRAQRCWVLFGQRCHVPKLFAREYFLSNDVFVGISILRCGSPGCSAVHNSWEMRRACVSFPALRCDTAILSHYPFQRWRHTKQFTNGTSGNFLCYWNYHDQNLLFMGKIFLGISHQFYDLLGPHFSGQSHVHAWSLPTECWNCFHWSLSSHPSLQEDSSARVYLYVLPLPNLCVSITNIIIVLWFHCLCLSKKTPTNFIFPFSTQ